MQISPSSRVLRTLIAIALVPLALYAGGRCPVELAVFGGAGIVLPSLTVACLTLAVLLFCQAALVSRGSDRIQRLIRQTAIAASALVVALVWGSIGATALGFAG